MDFFLLTLTSFQLFLVVQLHQLVSTLVVSYNKVLYHEILDKYDYFWFKEKSKLSNRILSNGHSQEHTRRDSRFSENNERTPFTLNYTRLNPEGKPLPLGFPFSKNFSTFLFHKEKFSFSDLHFGQYSWYKFRRER